MKVVISVHPHACGEYVGPGHPRSGRPSVHPHACGEYAGWGEWRGGHRFGSPPRVWGILSPSAMRFTAAAVHPHACGEYCGGRNCWSTASGSPPRVWGILQNCQRAARAEAVHPHACGEYGVLTSTSTCFIRFTPTRVGNTSVPARPRHHTRGSPPRVWGIRKSSAVGASSARFTPTRVGNTRGRSGGLAGRRGSPPRVWGIRPTGGRWRTASPVHPHACGEYEFQSECKYSATRFTPTRVGNTRTACIVVAWVYGSPPRVWGIRR